MKNDEFKDFIGIQQVQKTLKFRLLPEFETMETIEKKHYFENDYIRNQYYPILKNICDDFYRDYIDLQLNNLAFEWTELAESHQTEDRNKLEKMQDKYRKSIFNRLKDTVDEKNEKQKSQSEIKYGEILKADLIKSYLPDYIERKYQGEQKEEAQTAIQTYQRFASRLTNFWQSRQNVFTDDKIATAIPYRLVHDNFPLFLNNIDTYQKNYETLQKSFSCFEQELKNDGKLSREDKLEDWFSIDGFNRVCTQKGIDIYNMIIGGYTRSEYEKIQGINEIINLYQQQLNKNKTDKIRLGKLTKLNKQILSLSDSSSFLIEQIESDQDLLNKIAAFYDLLINASDSLSLMDQIELLPQLLANADQAKIYINAKYNNRISHAITSKNSAIDADWSLLNRGLKVNDQDSNTKKYFKVIDQEQDFEKLKTPIYFTIKQLDDAIEQAGIIDNKDYSEISIIDYLRIKEDRSFRSEIEYLYDKIKFLKENENNISGNIENIDLIKEFLDKIMKFYSKWQIFAVEELTDIDQAFYPVYIETMRNLSNIVRLYNLTRNYLSRKPSHKKKTKLNFNCPTLADGWSESKVKDNFTMLFRRGENFYLGIITNSKVLSEIQKLEKEKSDNYYERMNYLYMPDAAKMIPKCSIQLKEVKKFFGTNHIDDYYTVDSDQFNAKFLIPRAIYNMYFLDLYNDKKKFQKDYLKQTGDEVGFKEALSKWIDFSKDFIKKYQGLSHFDYSDLPSTDYYGDLSDFYKDVNSRSYKLNMTKIDSTALEELVKEGKLLLFRLYNKDFSEYTKGKPNLFTLYWQALFSEENLEKNIIKLNGQAELFLRTKQINKPIKHEKGSYIVNRFDVDGRMIASGEYQQIKDFLNNRIDEESLDITTKQNFNNHKYVYFKTDYEIIKDRRYTEDQFFFHVPISFNWDKPDTVRINDLANRYLFENKDIHVIGIDRGENHLLYYSVINTNGEIIEQGSLNNLEIENKYSKERNRIIPFKDMLEQKEKERAAARINWHAIDQIKDLKEGYLSHIVYFLSKLIIKYNAIVVLEDLNFGFKRGRFKVERQVYQKFEIALMNKLSCLAFKDKEFSEMGSVLYPWQLTRPVGNLNDIGKQNGILYYVPAAYTSVVDPVTGFANLFQFKSIGSDKKAEFFEKFEAIDYHPEEDIFSFTFNYNKFKQIVRIKNLDKSLWQVFTNDSRYHFSKNKKESYIEHKLTEEMKSILEKFDINYREKTDILAEFSSLDKIKKHNLANKLLSIFKNTVTLRNNDKSAHPDFIISPVKDENGNFFDSRLASIHLPENGDANGAYHIAQKGLLYRNNITHSLSENKKPSLKISNKEWFDYIMK